MKNAIKKYFEELIKTDDAIKSVYQETKLDGCITYIRDQAKARLNGKNGFVEDAVVYHWARDYMLGDIAKPIETKEKTVVQLEDAENLAVQVFNDMSKPANAEASDAPTKEKLVIESVIQPEEKKTAPEPMMEVTHPKAEELHQLSLFDF